MSFHFLFKFIVIGDTGKIILSQGWESLVWFSSS